MATIQRMMDSNWIDAKTRVVFVEFSTFNPDAQLFCSSTIYIELPLSGGMSPSWLFEVVPVRFLSCC